MARPCLSNVWRTAKRIHPDTVRSSFAAALRMHVSSSLVRRTCSIAVFVLVLGMVSPIRPVPSVEFFEQCIGPRHVAIIFDVRVQRVIEPPKHQHAFVEHGTVVGLVRLAHDVEQLADARAGLNTYWPFGRVVSGFEWAGGTRQRADVCQPSPCCALHPGAMFGESTHGLRLHPGGEAFADSVRTESEVFGFLVSGNQSGVRNQIAGVPGVAVAGAADRLPVAVAVPRAEPATIGHGGRQSVARPTFGGIGQQEITLFVVSDTHRLALSCLGFDPHRTLSVLHCGHKSRENRGNYG